MKIPRSESSKYQASERMLHTKALTPILKKRLMQPDERTPAVCLAPQTTMQAGSRLNVFSSCHHNHWISDALIVDDLDGRLVACQSVNNPCNDVSVREVLCIYLFGGKLVVS